MGLITTSIPEITSGIAALDCISTVAADLTEGRSALVVIDAFLMQCGHLERIETLLGRSGFRLASFAEFAGEPKLAHLRAGHANALASNADLVVGVGGGSALDIAKIVASTACGSLAPGTYAMAAAPLPVRSLPKIMIPTTAGTGSETSATNIFANEAGRKTWIWGRQTKADHVILDPSLTVSLPPNLTAWCGMDALVHAFEAATNRNTHHGAALFAHAALPLLAGALERAVHKPQDLVAREHMLLGSCYAGVAIDACGTAIAHMISHALSSLAPVHHGHATALAFEITLPWLVEADTPAMRAAASALGLEATQALPGFVTDLMDRAGIERRLPPAFDMITPEDLLVEMGQPEHAPMRMSTAVPVADEDLERFARSLLPGVSQASRGSQPDRAPHPTV